MFTVKQFHNTAVPIDGHEYRRGSCKFFSFDRKNGRTSKNNDLIPPSEPPFSLDTSKHTHFGGRAVEVALRVTFDSSRPYPPRFPARLPPLPLFPVQGEVQGVELLYELFLAVLVDSVLLTADDSTGLVGNGDDQTDSCLCLSSRHRGCCEEVSMFMINKDYETRTSYSF